MTTKRTNSLGGNKQARKQANAKRINAWRTARLALLLGLSLGLGIGAYSGSAFAVEHEIDGTAGKTFADVVNEGVIASGDTIKVIGSQSTGPASDYDALSFSIASSTTDNVTISGLGGNQRIFDGGSRRNTFEILGNETVTFTNAHNTNSGGGVFSITGYISNIPGIGAIPNPTGKITLQGINFADSSAKQGGAGYIDLAKGLSIDSVAFSGNSASSQGGALWLNNMMGDMSISNATFSENESVGGAGGAIYVDSYNKSNLTLENVTFEDNAGTRGGAIYVNDDITPVTLSGTNVFTNNDSTTADTEYGLGGGAILSKSTVTISGDNSFTDNTAVSAGGAISVCTASGAAENSNVKFTGDDGKYTFTDNTAGTKGGAVYSQGDVTFSGQNVTASFTGNEVTDGIMQTGSWAGYYEVQGHDIFAESDIHITGTGTYTFGGGVWAEGDGNLNANTIYDDGDFVMTKAGEGDLILTTGDTDVANTKYYSYGTISANNKVTLDGVIFQDSHLNTTGNAKVEGEVSGILFGNFGVNLYDTTVQNNSITADTTIAGTVYANTGNTTLWADETGRYSTLAGTTTFENNVITSSEGSAGGAINSVPYLFLGAVEGVNKPVAANGSDIAFNSNQAVGTGDATAEGGAVYTYRNVLLQSNDNTITFSGNKATAAAGDAFGGAIAALAYYDHGNDTGEFGVDFAGDGNDVLFSGNEATSTGGKGYGGAIAVYMGRDTANTPAVQLHGTDSLYTFENNEATTAGGAIYSEGNTLLKGEGSTFEFTGNTAGQNGGAIADVSNELLTISNSEFVSNEAGNNGGAIYSEGSVSVANTYFVDNSAGADGGAIYLEGNTAAQSLTIAASGGNEVLFDGNTGVVEGDTYDNAIAFMGTDVIGTKRIEFNAVGDSTISVLDGMEVDLAFDGSGEGSFTMDLVGAGTQNWDGQNNFRITNNAIGTVKLTSGNINLAKDFQMANVEGGTLNVNITGGDTGAQIGVDLNGRNTGFAMFDNPTEFNVDGVANVKIKTLRAFSDGEEEMWLVTDKRGDVEKDSFKLTDDSPIVETSIKTVEDNLYIAVVNKADEIIKNSADPNARRVRESVEETWNQAAEELAEVLPEEQVDGIYNEIIANTEVYTAEGIVSQAFGALDLTHQVMRQVYDYNRLGDQYDSGCSNDQTADIPLRAWGGYMGADGSLDTDGYHGFDQSWQGVLGGVSREGGNGGTIGTWFGYADGRNRFEDISTRLENKAYNTGVFAIFRLNNNTSLASDFTYGHYDNEARRSNQAGLYSGKFDQDTYGGGLTLRRDIVNGNRIFTPLVGVRYQHLVQGEYDEIANGVGEFANSLDAFTADSMQSRVGATFTTGFETANGRVISPMIYGMWRHEFMDNDFSTIGYYQSDSNEFMVASIARERDLADLGGTLSVSNNCTTVGVGYNATVTEGYRQHNWFAGMSYRF